MSIHKYNAGDVLVGFLPSNTDLPVFEPAPEPKRSCDTCMFDPRTDDVCDYYCENYIEGTDG